MDDYFSRVTRLKYVLVLLDSRRELNEDDIEIINYLEEKGFPYKLILTKVDKINQSEKHKLNQNIKSVGVNLEDVIYVSVLKPRTFDILRNTLEKWSKLLASFFVK